MIRSFRSKTAEDLYDGINSKLSRRIPKELHSKIYRLLDQLNAATRLETMKVPPSNMLENLKGNLKGYYSIRVNKQWRVVFRWSGSDAFNVDVLDYHS